MNHGPLAGRYQSHLHRRHLSFSRVWVLRPDSGEKRSCETCTAPPAWCPGWQVQYAPQWANRFSCRMAVETAKAESQSLPDERGRTAQALLALSSI